MTVYSPLDMALARLEDIPDAELLAVAEQLQEDAQESARRWARAKGELIRRIQATEATVIDAGDIICQVEWEKSYTWDMDAVVAEAPQFTGWTKERVIPAERIVSNTRGLNEYIKKLGRTAKAERLIAARQVATKNPKFLFHHPVSEGEADQ